MARAANTENPADAARIQNAVPGSRTSGHWTNRTGVGGIGRAVEIENSGDSLMATHHY